MRSKVYHISAVVFFAITVALGLILRWQFAGYVVPGLGDVELRRVHSHIGFYGLLFPLAWIHMKYLGAWVPGRRCLALYILMCLISLIAFPLQGYGPISIFSSTVVLGIWLLFALKNLRTRETWMKPIAPSIFISAFMIVGVAVLSKNQPELSLRMARGFLSLLLFGVFIPVALRTMSCRSSQPYLWLAASVMTSFYLTGVVESQVLAAGPLYIGVDLACSVWGNPRRHLSLLWLAFGLSLVLTVVSVLPHNHSFGIAGVHFLILGPLLMTYANELLDLERQLILTGIYKLGLGGMLLGIVLHQPLLTALGGSVLTVSAFTVLAWRSKKSAPSPAVPRFTIERKGYWNTSG